LEIKIEKGDIRNAVKLETSRASLRELQSKKYKMNLTRKKILMYHKFGSPKKKKRKYYFMQLGDELVSDIVECETLGLSGKEWQEQEVIQLAQKN
jgi:hypothetical protein